MTEKKRVSMYDAERKSLTKAKVIMGLVTILLFAMAYFNLFHTNLYMWQERAGGAAHIFGIAFYAISLLTLVFESRISNALTNETVWYIFWIIGILGGITISSGFNFSL